MRLIQDKKNWCSFFKNSWCLFVAFQRMRLDLIFCRDISRHLIQLELFHFPSFLLFRQFQFHNSSHVLLFLELTFGVLTQLGSQNKKGVFSSFFSHGTVEDNIWSGDPDVSDCDRKLPIQFRHLFLLWCIGWPMLIQRLYISSEN